MWTYAAGVALASALWASIARAEPPPVPAPDGRAEEAQGGDWMARAKELAALRVQVESLRSELEEARAEAAEAARANAAQERELRATVELERARVSALQATVERRQAERAGGGAGDERLGAALVAAADALRAAIDASIAYERTARLAAIDAIRQDLEAGALHPTAAADQLWTIAEDELRLSSDVGLSQQPVTLDGDRLLADVAHLGGVLVCLRTEDGRAACKPPGPGDLFTSTQAPREREAIRAWIDGLRGHTKQGLAELPLGQPAGKEVE